MADEWKQNPGGSTWFAYLQLCRAPNLFTAIADVAMGCLFVQPSLWPWSAFACLAVASALLYAAGAILNDVYDFAVDAVERPHRPLPSGRIALAWARWLGFELLVAGVAVGWLAGFANCRDGTPTWRSGAVASVLAVAVWSYDAWLKKTMVGPAAMGACRFLNVLLGMSVGASWPPAAWRAGYAGDELMVAGGIGVYVCGLSWYARDEAARSRRGALWMGVGLMVGGIGLLAMAPRFSPLERTFFIEPRSVWPAAVGLFALPVLRRCLSGIADPRPRRVQAAVKLGILSLIVLDAGVSLLVAPWRCAVAVLALLIPAFILGKRVYST